MYKLHCSQHAGSLPLFDWGVGCQGNSESVQIFEANYRMLSSFVFVQLVMVVWWGTDNVKCLSELISCLQITCYTLTVHFVLNFGFQTISIRSVQILTLSHTHWLVSCVYCAMWHHDDEFYLTLTWINPLLQPEIN